MGYQQAQQGYGYPQQHPQQNLQQPLNQGSSFNPFSALMFGQDMGYPQQPPPHMYQPPPYSYMYPPPPQGQQSPPPPQQKQGNMFQNHIFGQLTNNNNQGYNGGW